jgi:hypothetical protein
MVNHSPDESVHPLSPKNAATWYLIVSLPGAVSLILLLGAYALGGVGSFAIGFVFWTVFSPCMWVFPIVAGRQIHNLASRKFVPISSNTYIGMAILLGLYLWWGLAAKFLMNMDG